uniref:G-protein coupled receptors family 1 profile domain-containing protein n=1 Tax=Acrobeloides nanus TaxID=290746 RepID=A0A914EFA2_9BILA
MNAICLVVTPTIYEINFFTYKNPCDLYVKTWRCLLMRIPINLSKVGFTLMHLVIFLERAIATIFPSKYESLNNRSIGIITAITMWIIILGSNAFIFSNEDWNASKSYYNMHIYSCGGTSFSPIKKKTSKNINDKNCAYCRRG